MSSVTATILKGVDGCETGLVAAGLKGLSVHQASVVQCVQALRMFMSASA